MVNHHHEVSRHHLRPKSFWWTFAKGIGAKQIQKRLGIGPGKFINIKQTHHLGPKIFSELFPGIEESQIQKMMDLNVDVLF